MPGRSYSTGSSTVSTLLVAASIWPSAAYSVVVLPLPVGPVTSTMPCGWCTRRSSSASTPGAMPRRSSLRRPASLSSSRSTARSPCRWARWTRGCRWAGRPRAARCGRPAAALLGDVQVGHDLDARDQRRMQRLARADHVAQATVDAVAHHRMRLERLDVDVAGAVARGLGEQGVDHADDGRVVLGVEQVRDFRHLVHQPVQVDLVLGRADHGGGVAGGVGVGRRQQGLQLGVGGLAQRHRAMAAAHFGDGPGRRQRADDQLVAVARAAQRPAARAPRHRAGASRRLARLRRRARS